MKKIAILLSALLVMALGGPAMASFKRTVPANVSELQAYLMTIHGAKSHVKSVRWRLNMAEYRVEIDLDDQANLAGQADVYLPIKRGKINDAKGLVARIAEQPEDAAPTEADARALFDMIDPSGR